MLDAKNEEVKKLICSREGMHAYHNSCDMQHVNALSKCLSEGEMIGWHHRLDGHESEQAPGVGDGQGSLACCSPWGLKELYTAERMN